MEIRALLSAMWRSRTGPLLVAAQVAITLAVVVNVAYIIQQRLENIARPIGMDVENMFWVVSQSFGRDYNHVATIESDLDYLQRLPGVVAAASTANIPQGFGSSVLAFATTQEELDKGGGTPATVFFGSARYIETLGVKLSAGRGFDPAATMPSADSYRQMMGNWSSEIVITKNLADKLWPKGDALGKTLYTGLVNKPATIVGIIEHFQHQPVQGRARDLFQTAVMATALSPPPVINYMIRAKPGQRDALMARVEKEFTDRNPGRFIRSMEAFTDTVRRTRASARSSVITLSVVAVFVVAVTMVGIVGLAAFTVATRTKQLGTRRAIGATKFHILRYFLVENWLITSMGAIVGCALALGVGIKLSLLYEMPRLPLYYLVGGVFAVWMLGLAAVFVPARRAAGISPATATRTV
jgi:putative ABC transport system permease protein